MKTIPISKKKPHPSGDKNRLAVLTWVHLFGCLRATEIARIVWSNSNKNSAQVAASRVLERLRDLGQVEVQPNLYGGDSYVLTKAGADCLQEKGIDADAKYPSSMVVGLGFWHRFFGTRYLIERFVQGHRVWGEHAIESARAPACRPELLEFCGKLPDGFVEVGTDEDGVRLLDWIEIESVKVKGKQDIARMAAVALKTGQPLNTGFTAKLARVVIVYDVRQGHEARLLKGIEAYLETVKDPAERDRVKNALVFVRCTVTSPLNWIGMEEVRVADLLKGQASPEMVPEGTEEEGDYSSASEDDEVARWDLGREAREADKGLTARLQAQHAAKWKLAMEEADREAARARKRSGS